jgi:hypothetical protein
VASISPKMAPERGEGRHDARGRFIVTPRLRPLLSTGASRPPTPCLSAQRLPGANPTEHFLRIPVELRTRRIRSRARAGLGSG